MAKRAVGETVTLTSNNTSVLDIPEGGLSVSNGDGIVNVEDVFQTQVDMEEQAAIADVQLLPQGDYVTVPPLSVQEPRHRKVMTLGERVNGAVQQLDEPVEFERSLISFYGPVINEDGLTGRLGFEISPQAVYTINRKGKFGPDRVTKITQSAIRLFKADTGQTEFTYGELAEFLKTTPIMAFVMKLPASEDGRFEPSNMIVSIGRVS